MRRALFSRLFAVQSDGRLLALACRGNDLAFEALARRHCRSLLIYCRRLPLPDARVQAVVQRALLDGWAALREGAEVEDARAWLHALVRAAAVENVRDAAAPDAIAGALLGDRTLGDRKFAGARAGDVSFTLPAPAGPAPAGPAPAAPAEPVVGRALADIDALPPLQREVIVRADLLGHPSERVAGELGIADGVVRRLLLKARASLRAAADVLIPPPLLNLIAGGAGQGAPTPERITELLAGGSTAGLGGLLVKGGVAAVTVGLLGATIVHAPRSSRPHRRPATLAPADAGEVASARGVPPRVERATVGSRWLAHSHRLAAGTTASPSSSRARARRTARVPGALGGLPTSASQPRPHGPATAPQSPAATGSPGTGQSGLASGGSNGGGSAGAGSGGGGSTTGGSGGGSGSGSSTGAGSGAGSSSGPGGANAGLGGSAPGGGQGVGTSGGGVGGSGAGGGGSGQGAPGPGSGSAGAPAPGGLVGSAVQVVGGLVEGVYKIATH
jgi:DNA-directed RNA polymerase specialized sigma24 family protein